MAPFSYINPCGYQGLRVTQMKDFGGAPHLSAIEQRLAQTLISLLQNHLAR